MTCQEFRDMIEKDPTSCTDSELIAVATHALACNPCREIVRSGAEVARSLFPAGILAVSALEGSLRASEIRRKAETDTELKLP